MPPTTVLALTAALYLAYRLGRARERAALRDGEAAGEAEARYREGYHAGVSAGGRALAERVHDARRLVDAAAPHTHHPARWEGEDPPYVC